MKVRALKTFEGIKDLERDVFPKAGDEWEVSAERADLLLKHGVVEIVEEKIEEVVLEPITEVKKEEPVEYLSEPEVKEEKPKKKKSSKK